MRIVLLGPPGVGKGSLASLCETRAGLAHLSTGEIFRQEIARHSALGRRVRAFVTSGRLVPDALVVRVMASRLGARAGVGVNPVPRPVCRADGTGRPDSRGIGREPSGATTPFLPLDIKDVKGGSPWYGVKGFVLDGFPRTEGQARGLDRLLQRLGRPLDGAVVLWTTRTVLIRRLSGRLVCPRCGANYHVVTMRPQRRGRCNRCRESLVARKDDRPDMVRKRLAIYERAAAPLLAYYRRDGRLCRVSGTGSIEAVFARTMHALRRKGWG